MEGFAGTLVYYGAYVILGIWALLLIVDLLFITADETKEAFNEAFTYNSGIILFALAVLFYQWLYLNYTELPLLGNLVAEIDALLKTILPQG
jgi:glucose uptake protein GlcU